MDPQNNAIGQVQRFGRTLRQCNRQLRLAQFQRVPGHPCTDSGGQLVHRAVGNVQVQDRFEALRGVHHQTGVERRAHCWVARRHKGKQPLGCRVRDHNTQFSHVQHFSQFIEQAIGSGDIGNGVGRMLHDNKVLNVTIRIPVNCNFTMVVGIR